MKRPLSKSNYKFILKELMYQREKEIITEEQFNRIVNSYEEVSSVNFIRILVTIGAILIGLGILSFVASNWDYISKISKIIIIISVLGISMFTSFKLESSYEKTSKALLYLSALIYGSGIFLIGQIFNYGGEFTTAFLLWAVGILAISLIMKEKILFMFSHVLLIIYINGNFRENIIIYPLILISIFYIGNKYFNHDKFITFLNNAATLNFILYLLDYMNLNNSYRVIIFLLIGLGMYYIKHNLNLSIFKLQGLILIGINGVVLTYKYVWQELPFINSGSVIAVVFGILLLIYLLSLVRKGLLIPLVFICILILRYYFDTLYNFMPKSLFFVVGGLILLGFGYYFEKLRKSLGGELDE
ncbi:DUF2157 domain-containing protein [Clostridium aestuarii]|uniref:DUF2157 domain-containing protein n=1 Tax=Clostridium aestuarii TaxID=338193 RepID=A0ABT4CYT8_9CLOT|nr:DUF2157 domain-containing protein [Clostridium aestuarii]MCY6484138.1 DUF2157 domain-containing protein [Clostridium aestuarii]